MLLLSPDTILIALCAIFSERNFASVQIALCVQVTNISATEQSLGGFTLKSVSEGVEIAYKFHRTVKVSSFNPNLWFYLFYKANRWKSQGPSFFKTLIGENPKDLPFLNANKWKSQGKKNLTINLYSLQKVLRGCTSLIIHHIR